MEDGTITVRWHILEKEKKQLHWKMPSVLWILILTICSISCCISVLQAAEAGMQEEGHSIRDLLQRHIVQAVRRGWHSVSVQIYVCLCAVAVVQADIIRVEVYN